MNPSNPGRGGNTSCPSPVQLGSLTAPASSVSTSLGSTTSSVTDGNTVHPPNLSVAENSTGNEETGATPLTSVDGVNAPTTIDDTADDEGIDNLADNFQKISRSNQDGLSPEFKNQSPQEKCLRAPTSLNKCSLTGMKDEELARAMHQTSKTPESWLLTYLRCMEQDSTLAPPSLVRDLEEFSDCQDTRKHLGENMQLTTFGDKVVAATSPSFIKEHAMPLAMMRKCAEDLIKARSLIDFTPTSSNTEGTREHDLKSEDRCGTLANYFAVANPIGEEPASVGPALIVVFLHVRSAWTLIWRWKRLPKVPSISFALSL